MGSPTNLPAGCIEHRGTLLSSLRVVHSFWRIGDCKHRPPRLSIFLDDSVPYGRWWMLFCSRPGGKERPWNLKLWMSWSFDYGSCRNVQNLDYNLLSCASSDAFEVRALCLRVIHRRMPTHVVVFLRLGFLLTVSCIHFRLVLLLIVSLVARLACTWHPAVPDVDERCFRTQQSCQAMFLHLTFMITKLSSWFKLIFANSCL